MCIAVVIRVLFVFLCRKPMFSDGFFSSSFGSSKQIILKSQEKHV